MSMNGRFLGLEETEAGVWQLFVAVSLHSCAVAFCIGSELLAKGALANLKIFSQGMKIKFFVFCLSFW